MEESKKETRKIYVFRHTESIDNANDVFSGDRDYGLTDDGRLRAYELAKKLKSANFGIAFTSPLKRCTECLDIVLDGFHEGVNVIIDDRLIERDYGLLEGYQKHHTPWYIKIVKFFTYRSWRIDPPGGESFDDVFERVNEFNEYLMEVIRKDKVNIAICGHNNALKPVRAFLEDYPPKKAVTELNSEHGVVYTYEVEV